MPRWYPFWPYFWSLVEKTDGCWWWKGGTAGHGYGRIWKDGRRQVAHRVAYEDLVGPIPRGMLACHHCDNKLCVNPDHIFIGTYKDNMQDWTRKGKNKLISDPSLLKRGDDHWTRKPKGRKWRKEISALRKKEFRTGRRVPIRDNKGRIMGTRMVLQ